MKLNTSRRIHYEAGPNMTPLVDIVMVILIFLMLAGSFGGMEHYLATNIALATKDKAGQTKRSLTNDVIVDIRVDADPADPNAWHAVYGNVRTSNPDELKAKLHKTLDEYEKSKTDIQKIQVIINPNRFVKWKSLIAVYGAADDAGYKKIAFLQSH